MRLKFFWTSHSWIDVHCDKLFYMRFVSKVHYLSCITAGVYYCVHLLTLSKWLCAELCSSFHVRTQSASCLDSMMYTEIEKQLSTSLTSNLPVAAVVPNLPTQNSAEFRATVMKNVTKFSRRHTVYCFEELCYILSFKF